MSEEKQKWWQNLPGMLMAITGFITAITSVIWDVGKTFSYFWLNR